MFDLKYENLTHFYYKKFNVLINLVDCYYQFFNLKYENKVYNF